MCRGIYWLETSNIPRIGAVVLKVNPSLLHSSFSSMSLDNIFRCPRMDPKGSVFSFFLPSIGKRARWQLPCASKLMRPHLEGIGLIHDEQLYAEYMKRRGSGIKLLGEFELYEDWFRKLHL